MVYKALDELSTNASFRAFEVRNGLFFTSSDSYFAQGFSTEIGDTKIRDISTEVAADYESTRTTDDGTTLTQLLTYIASTNKLKDGDIIHVYVSFVDLTVSC